MKFEHTCTMPLAPAAALALLQDVAQVAACIPGATVEEHDGHDVRGEVTVPIAGTAVTYRGEARILDVDPDARTAVIGLTGEEADGTGTVLATVRARLVAHGPATVVELATDADLTGTAASHGAAALQAAGDALLQGLLDRLVQGPPHASATDAADGADGADGTAIDDPAQAPAAAPEAATSGSKVVASAADIGSPAGAAATRVDDDTDAVPVDAGADAVPVDAQPDAQPDAVPVDAEAGAAPADARSVPAGGAEPPAPSASSPGPPPATVTDRRTTGFADEEFVELAGPAGTRDLLPWIGAAAAVAAVALLWLRRWRR